MKKYTSSIYKQRFLGHVQQKNLAVRKAKYDWILSLDADERATKDIQNIILKMKKSGFQYDGYYLNRLGYYLTDWFKLGGWYPDKKVRLFNRKKGKWAGENPHDFIQMNKNSKIGYLNADILHYTNRTLSQHISQINSFSSIAAKVKYKKKTKFVTLHIIMNSFFKFIKTFFIQGAFLAGSRGFIFSIMASFSVFAKYAKLWEIKNCKKK